MTILVTIAVVVQLASFAILGWVIHSSRRMDRPANPSKLPQK